MVSATAPNASSTVAPRKSTAIKPTMSSSPLANTCANANSRAVRALLQYLALTFFSLRCNLPAVRQFFRITRTSATAAARRACRCASADMNVIATCGHHSFAHGNAIRINNPKYVSAHTEGDSHLLHCKRPHVRDKATAQQAIGHRCRRRLTTETHEPKAHRRRAPRTILPPIYKCMFTCMQKCSTQQMRTCLLPGNTTHAYGTSANAQSLNNARYEGMTCAKT